MGRLVVLSPHYDDAALSLGGAIHQLTQAGQPVVVMTLFAAPPAPGQTLSPLVARLHGRGVDAASAVAARQLEDDRALAILGATAQRLGYCDAVYRVTDAANPRYGNLRQLFGAIHPDEAAWPAQLAQAVRDADIGAVRYLAPLGVGGHVDHQQAHRAGRALADQGHEVCFYEDYPYVDGQLPTRDPVTLAQALAQAGDVTAELCPLSSEDMGAWIASVVEYRSQMRALFGPTGSDAVADRLRAFARARGHGQPAVRWWRPA